MTDLTHLTDEEIKALLSQALASENRCGDTMATHFRKVQSVCRRALEASRIEAELAAAQAKLDAIEKVTAATTYRLHGYPVVDAADLQRITNKEKA